MNDRLQAATSGMGGPRQGWIGGRAHRAEYWLYVGPILLLSIILAAMGQTALSMLATIPMLFIWIRRLHDLGHSGWWAPAINVGTNILAFVLQMIGPMGSVIAGLLYLGVIIGLGCIPPEPRDNEFGAAPGRKADLKETFS